jgi:hypothetical protein
MYHRRAALIGAERCPCGLAIESASIELLQQFNEPWSQGLHEISHARKPLQASHARPPDAYFLNRGCLP